MVVARVALFAQSRYEATFVQEFIFTTNIS